MCITNRNDMTFAVKVALNLNSTNQPILPFASNLKLSPAKTLENVPPFSSNLSATSVSLEESKICHLGKDEDVCYLFKYKLKHLFEKVDYQIKVSLFTHRPD